MKKSLILGLMVIGIAFVSCRKKDIQPVISLNGNYEQTISLGQSYVESGATAQDNKDGDISEDIKISGVVNTNLVGEYRVFYDVKDSEGNKAATAKRFVKVVNDANYMVGTYEATPTCSGSGTVDSYNTSITASDKNNNQILIRRVLYTIEDDPVVGNVSGTSITIPVQNIGLHTVEGSGNIVNGDFILSIIVNNGATYNCTINHVKI
jgi:hypothetical protein